MEHVPNCDYVNWVRFRPCKRRLRGRYFSGQNQLVLEVAAFFSLRSFTRSATRSFLAGATFFSSVMVDSSWKNFRTCIVQSWKALVKGFALQVSVIPPIPTVLCDVGKEDVASWHFWPKVKWKCIRPRRCCLPRARIFIDSNTHRQAWPRAPFAIFLRSGKVWHESKGPHL